MRQIGGEDDRPVAELRAPDRGGGGNRRLADAALSRIEHYAHGYMVSAGRLQSLGYPLPEAPNGVIVQVHANVDKDLVAGCNHQERTSRSSAVPTGAGSGFECEEESLPQGVTL